MTTVFYVAAAIAILSTALAITHLQAVRALLYVIVSFLAVGVIFFLLGAPFAAALEVITYAGAIMVLFVFVIMMLNLGPVSRKQERDWFNPRMMAGPTVLSAFLLASWIYAVTVSAGKTPGVVGTGGAGSRNVGPEIVGHALLTRYLIGVELASVLLLAGLVGAYHVGYRRIAQRSAEGEREPAREAA